MLLLFWRPSFSLWPLGSSESVKFEVRENLSLQNGKAESVTDFAPNFAPFVLSATTPPSPRPLCLFRVHYISPMGPP